MQYVRMKNLKHPDFMNQKIATKYLCNMWKIQLASDYTIKNRLFELEKDIELKNRELKDREIKIKREIEELFL